MYTEVARQLEGIPTSSRNRAFLSLRKAGVAPKSGRRRAEGSPNRNSRNRGRNKTDTRGGKWGEGRLPENRLARAGHVVMICPAHVPAELVEDASQMETEQVCEGRRG